MPFGYSAWLFLKNNRAAQYALGIAFLVAIFLFWLSRHDDKVRQLQNARAERQARKTQTKIQEASNAKSEKVAIARDTAPRVVHSAELPDDTRSRLFGNRRNG